MKFYRIQSVQQLPISLEKAWDFFSSPFNLKEITPPHMGFEITSGQKPGEKMYQGQIITYKLSLLPGIKINWMTEITHVKDNEYFVDEQRFGPYALWHHTHYFKEINGGVEMTDSVYYVLPFGILGRFAHFIFVKNELSKIFEYRRRIVEKRFGKMN